MEWWTRWCQSRSHSDESRCCESVSVNIARQNGDKTFMNQWTGVGNIHPEHSHINIFNRSISLRSLQVICQVTCYLRPSLGRQTATICHVKRTFTQTAASEPQALSRCCFGICFFLCLFFVCFLIHVSEKHPAKTSSSQPECSGFVYRLHSLSSSSSTRLLNHTNTQKHQAHNTWHMTVC